MKEDIKYKLCDYNKDSLDEIERKDSVSFTKVTRGATMISSKKKISIIIATFNAASTLRYCLDSVVPQLTKETELILVDGGSKDDTNAIIYSYGDRVSIHISESDKGIYDAWNKGVKAAKGDWLMFIGADDKLLSGALDYYLKFTAEHSFEEYDFISAKIKSVKKDRTFLQYANKIWSYKRCRINMDVIHTGSLTSMNYFKHVGYFNILYKICGDYDLLMRGGKEMKAVRVNYPILEMPIGGISFSLKGLLEQKEIKQKVGNVPTFISYLILLGQMFLFYTYTIRHSFKL